MLVLAIFIALIFFYSLIAGRIERTIITAPILFTAAGMLVFLVLPDFHVRRANLEVFLDMAEVGLVLLLFTDASRTDIRILRRMGSLAVRLLSTGMVLTILMGMVVAVFIFPSLSVWEAGIIAAILAPTDAGLGQVIVTSPQVPMRIRQALNVEAGLNDGLSVPFLLFFIGLAAVRIGGDQTGFVTVILHQLGLGAVVGGGYGGVGGWLLGLAQRRKWMNESSQSLAVVALPLLCAVTCEAVEASMFIAAFVAGWAVQVGFKDAGKHGVEFTESWGQLFNLSVFFLFGLLQIFLWGGFTLPVLLYAVLSLTLVRMLPVALALMGAQLNWATIVFMGWFGPRGLASIVLGLVYFERKANLPPEPLIRAVVMATVLLSIFAHGLTALPGIRLYERKIRALDANSPERRDDDQGPTPAHGLMAVRDHVHAERVPRPSDRVLTEADRASARAAETEPERRS